VRHLSYGALIALVAGLAMPGMVSAQGRGGAPAGRAGGPPPAAKAIAPEDITGTYVAVVTEHWHLRMLVPPKGEFAMLPLNPEARRIANTWDPAKEPAGDEQCKSYGAAAIMRIPGRVDIRWADDNTLKEDFDAGTQSRLLHFAAPSPTPAPATTTPTWQGYSVASWEGAGNRGRGGPGDSSVGHLKVVTTRMKPGYLRKNGVPYSENAVLEEYYDHFTEPDGTTWLVVTTVVTDPMYLTGPYVTTNHFKKIPDRQGWDPTPCKADQAR
jgi:hypothetical protein